VSIVSLLVDPRVHAAIILAVMLMRVLYAILSRVVAPYPRLRAIVEAVAALGPDVLRAGQQLLSALSGRPVASLDLRAPDPEAVRWRERAEAAERRVAELAGAGAPAAPVERVADETTREGRATIAPGTLGMLVLALALASGCGGPVLTNPGAQVAARLAWPSVHKGAVSAGLCDEDPPEWLVGPTPKRDAGADASPLAPNDAGPSPAADSDASPGAPAGASTEGDR
jgi:hypothetical protein